MGTTPNPFANAINNWGVDPKAAAEGQYISTNTQLKAAELEKQKGILDARKRLATYNLHPAALDAALSNDSFKADDVLRASGFGAAHNTLIGADGKPVAVSDPRVLASASLLLGNAPNETIGAWGSGAFQKPATSNGDADETFIKGTNGGPDMIFNKRTGQARLATISGPGAPAAAPAAPAGQPVAKQPAQPAAAQSVAGVMPNTYQKIVPSVTPGVPSTIVTYQLGANGQENILKVENVDTRSGQALSTATLSQLRKDRSDADRQKYAKAVQSGNPFEWLLNKHMGMLDADGNRTNPGTAINTVEMNSFVNTAKRFHNAGYDITESFQEALKAHPGLAAGRGNMEGKEWGSSFFNMDIEKDAAGRVLQDLGRGDTELLTSKKFKQNLKPSMTPSGNTIPSGKPDDPLTPDFDESIQYEVDTANTDYSDLKGAVPVPFEISAIGGNKNSVSNLFSTKTAKPQIATEMKDETKLVPSQIGKWVYQNGPDGNPTFGIVIKDPKSGKPKFSPVTGELPE
jgi:hypothetical protein